MNATDNATITGTCRGFSADRDTDPCRNCGADYGRHGGTIVLRSFARTEYGVSFDGQPISLSFTDRADAEDYLERGVAAGNDRSRYAIISRGVVATTTDWTVA